MADYYPLIARAVAGLEKNTGDARRALYERARTALVAQLRSVTPALSESDVTRERLALEESVRKVEAESARQNRVELRPEASKMRPPEMPRWEEPTPVPSSAEDPAPLHRAGSTPPRSDNLRRPPQPARTENGPAPPEGGLGEKHHADAVSDQPSLDVPLPVLGAARPQRHALRARPSGDRHSLLDSVDQFRNVVSETNDVAEMSVRPSKSARRSYAEAPPIMRDIDRGTPGGFGRNDADEVLQDAPAPEMLEPKLGLDEMRPLSNRPRPSQFVRDARQETERPSARSYRDLIRLAIALLLVSEIGRASCRERV